MILSVIIQSIQSYLLATSNLAKNRKRLSVMSHTALPFITMRKHRFKFYAKSSSIKAISSSVTPQSDTEWAL